MGACLSCLGLGDSTDDELNETSSLLRNQQMFSDDYLQEAELLKQQQRQSELNIIVNDLSDHLIDVTTFLNEPSTNQLSYLITSIPEVPTEGLTDGVKNYPYQYTNDEKVKVMNEIDQLDDSIRKECEILSEEGVYLNL